MKQIMKGLTAVAVGCAMLFAAACGDGGEDIQGNTPMGRYVESQTVMPEGNANSIHLMRDGSVNVFAYGAESMWLCSSTRDFESWQLEENGWQAKMGEGEYIVGIAYDSQDQLYVISESYQGSDDDFTIIPKLWRISLDGADLEEVPISWYQSADNSYYVSVGKMAVLGNGDYLVYQSFDYGIVQYGSDGSFKNLYTAGYGSSFAVSGNSIAILDSDGSVRIYDGETSELVSQVEFENHSRSTYIYYGQNEALYIQNDSGLYRLSGGGNLWEKVIDGDLTSMALPNLYFADFIETEDGDFYMVTGDGQGSSAILRYHFDPDVAALPENELVIYTLAENSTVRIAAGEFQKLNPNTKVSIQVTGGDGGVTDSDLIRTLNTELLNGKGPDILILDGMNTESYINKGVLMDVADVVEELMQESSMVESVLRTYEKDGKIHAVPAKFNLPVMVVDQDAADQLNSLEDLARYAAAHPEKGVMGDMRPEALLNALVPASSSAWIKDSALDTEKLEAFLESVKTIMDTGAPSHEYPDQEPGERYIEQFHYAFGRSHACIANMRGVFDTTSINTVIDTKGDGVVKYLAGQQEKNFVPRTITGINVNTSQPEMAKEFLKLMFRADVQHEQGVAGFSVSIDALELEASDFRDDVTIGTSNPFVEGEELFGEWAPVEKQQEIVRLAMGVENPSVLDETLKTMIIDAAKGYLTGEKSLDQAAADVAEATKLYLAE